jgi:DNA-directed RNA polymerase subunit RPC12/RpoP
LVAVITPMAAQTTVSVNYDKKTVAAMATAFGTEVATEAYYNEQVKKVLEQYSAAEVAAAGIFSSKYLDRKALTDLGIWGNSTENYYYRRIYKLVSSKIMPKIWTVAGLMLQSPHTALYWGSYLMKICAETKALCMQFESVVTNGKLGFSDLTFLELVPEVEALFKLSEAGNIDWKTILDGFGNIRHNFTKESLKSDIQTLCNMGVGLANAGAENVLQHVLSNSTFNGTFMDKANSIANIVENTHSLYQSLDKSLGNTLLGMLGGKASVSKLFTASEYNLSSWMTDYTRETMGQYYTQQWYICRHEAGSETLCDYTPSTDDDAILKGSEWVRFETTDADFTPSSEQLEVVLCNSESYAGWSRAKVKQMNASDNSSRYTCSYNRHTYNINKKSKLVKKAYAYSFNVVRSWYTTDVVDEQVFDSYSMDETTFQNQLQVLLAEYNDNDEGVTYSLEASSKRYYNATDAAKMKGCESVIISVTCSDTSELGQGNTQYKCSDCGSTLSDHTKECSMKTSVTESNLDLSEMDNLEAQYANQVVQLRQEIATTTDADELAKLKQELTEVQNKQLELEEARQEAATDNAETDDYYRIPAIMSDCQTAYSLSWTGQGSWSGYTLVREATMPNISGAIKFQATLSVVRKPKHFMGIKIHRAIIGIAWKLSADYSDKQVIDVLTFDGSKSDEEKAAEVNKRISEIAQDYPNCEVSTEYIKSDATEDDSTEDTLHLLWSSDRLEIAREIDTRLTHIYADLVSLEKMMHYKLSIVDILGTVTPEIDDKQGKKQTITEEAHDRWMRSAKYLGKEGGKK